MADMCVMEVMNSYESLRSFLVRSSNDISNIETMKKRFKLSKRKLDFVTNVAVLIKILEKLGELDSFRIHPIEIINENLDNVTLKNELLQRIRAHKSLISKCSIPEHSVNLYANDVLVREHDSLSQTGERNTSNLSCTYNESCGVQNQANDVLVRERDSLSQTGERNTSNLSCTYNESSGVQNQVFKQVIDHISLKIGMRWKEFARYINMEEEEIEEIDDCSKLNQREKARKCLNLLLKKENPDSAKTIILEALKKSRRNDIRKEIELMF